MSVSGDPERMLKNVLRKIKKGAHFVVTQPVYDIKAARRVFEKLKDVPVIAGIMPLVSYRNAEYLHYEVPGIEIPEEFLRRMKGKSGREGELEGIEIAVEVIEGIIDLVNGILFMPPLGKYRLIPEILEKLGEI